MAKSEMWRLVHLGFEERMFIDSCAATPVLTCSSSPASLIAQNRTCYVCRSGTCPHVARFLRAATLRNTPPGGRSTGQKRFLSSPHTTSRPTRLKAPWVLREVEHQGAPSMRGTNSSGLGSRVRRSIALSVTLDSMT